VDHTGSEESKQPAGNRGASSEDSADEQRAGGERPEQGDEPESARRAFDLLERFSGELEEILEALERTRGSGTPTEKSQPLPERAFRPASIHFESSPISTRIDPRALPPVESRGATTRSAPRLLLEGLFLILVAAISARSGQRPLLIVAAEAVAFVIVFSIELALAREKRRVQRLPAAAPLLAVPEERTTVTVPGVTSRTLDQVEPLVWTDRQEYAEPDWPLGAFELPREAEDTGEAPEGATEISGAGQSEAELVAAREPAPEAPVEADPGSAASTSIVEPAPAVEASPEVEAEAAPAVEIEAESSAEVEQAEPVPARPRRFNFHREAKAPEVELEPEAEMAGEVATEPEAEPAPEVEPAFEAESLTAIEGEEEPESEAESSAEAEQAEPAPAARPGRFHFHREAKAPEVEPEARAEVEPEIEAEPAPEIESEVEAESRSTIAAEVKEPARTSRFHPFRHDAQAPEVEAEAEPAIEDEEPAQSRRLHLFRHEAKTPEAELEPEPEPAAEAEPAPEVEAESPPSIVAEVKKPARTSHFHPFRHEAEAPEPEPATEIELPPVAEIETESSPEAVAEEGERERPRRFHLPHRETQEPEAEPELEAENPPEIAPEDETPERPRHFHLLHRETGEPEEEPEVKLESTLEIPASEIAPERHGLSRLFARDETLEVEAESPPEVIAEESEPEVFAAEAEPEPPRRFHLFRHEERLLDAAMEHAVAAEPEDELRPDVESPPEAADEAEESEPEPPRRFHLFRHEAAAEARDRDDGLATVPWPSLPGEPADATGGGEMTVEIELPPEIAVGEIEHTLEDLGRRAPGLRRRRRRHAGAGAVREVAQPAIEDETASEDGELRFAAEQERRRREREYLRKLRVSR
jgi:hypothetical protein